MTSRFTLHCNDYKIYLSYTMMHPTFTAQFHYNRFTTYQTYPISIYRHPLLQSWVIPQHIIFVLPMCTLWDHSLPQSHLIQAALIAEHNAKYNPRGIKRGAEESGNSQEQAQPDVKRLCIEKTMALSDEALIENKFLHHSLSIVFVWLL